MEQVMQDLVGLRACFVETLAAEGGLRGARFLQLDTAAVLFE
jgi:hypothetical protein